jgi:hypothetical protein
MNTTEEQRPSDILGDKRKDNTEVNLKEIGIEDMKWIHLAKDMVQWWTLTWK